MNEESSPPQVSVSKATPIIVRILLGALMGGVLVVAFLAYGQPDLLLEQMNIRYCG